jgi:hypothetical protein
MACCFVLRSVFVQSLLLRKRYDDIRARPANPNCDYSVEGVEAAAKVAMSSHRRSPATFDPAAKEMRPRDAAVAVIRPNRRPGQARSVEP